MKGNIFLWIRAQVPGTKTENREQLTTWKRDVLRGTVAFHPAA